MSGGQVHLLYVDDDVALALVHLLEAHRRRVTRDGLRVAPAFDRLSEHFAGTLLHRHPTLDPSTLLPPEEPAVQPLLVDLNAAAAILGVSTRTVQRLVKAGDLPAVEVGRCTRFAMPDLHEYVARARQQATGRDTDGPEGGFRRNVRTKSTDDGTAA